jgi:HK97 family phage major capsid protein
MDDKTLTMDEFQKQLGDMFDSKIREMGLDKVDRKNAIFPSADDPNGDSLKDLTKDERIAKFLQAVVIGDAKVAKELAEGTGADGGYLVPVEFRAAVLEKLLKEAVIRPRATVIPMGRDKLEIPAEAGGVTAYWTSENSPLTESNPTFGQIVLNTNKLTGLSYMSRELFADSAVNITDYITRMFAKKFAAEEDLKFMTGSGTGEPKGLREYTVSDIPQASADLAGDDLIALFYELPVQYRAKGLWLMNNSIIKLVRQLKSAIDGRYIWTDGLADAPATILGRPVLEQNDIPVDLGKGGDESEIWFGDLSYYLIGDRQTIEVESTTQGAGTFEKHQVAMKMIERLDGQLGLEDAFVLLTGVK